MKTPKLRTSLLALLLAASCGGPSPVGSGPPLRTPLDPPEPGTPRPSNTDFEQPFMTPSRPEPDPDPGALARLQVVDMQIEELTALELVAETAPLFEERGRLLESFGRYTEAIAAWETAARIFQQYEPRNPGRATRARAEAVRLRGLLPQEPEQMEPKPVHPERPGEQAH